MEELEQNRRRRLLVSVADAESARNSLARFDQPVKLLEDGTLELGQASAIEHPDVINRLLVEAGLSPTRLAVEEEGLEEYFLRLVGVNGGRNAG